MVAYYNLDETSGITVFDSVGNSHGNNSGGKQGSVGLINTAYGFNPDEDAQKHAVNISNLTGTNLPLSTLTTPITINFWAYRNGSNTLTTQIIGGINAFSADSWTTYFQACLTGCDTLPLAIPSCRFRSVEKVESVPKQIAAVFPCVHRLGKKPRTRGR